MAKRDEVSELAELRRFRSEVLEVLKRAADGVWTRWLFEVKGTGPGKQVTIEDIKTPAPIRAVQDANIAVVKVEITLEGRIRPDDGGNWATLQRDPRLKRRWVAAHDQFSKAIRGVKGWQELVVCDLASWAAQPTLTVAERRIIERRLLEFTPSLVGALAQRDQQQELGRLRAEQRRREMRHHRSEFEKMVEACPDDPPKKNEAAASIAAECVKAGKQCRSATVLEHLKKPPRSAVAG